MKTLFLFWTVFISTTTYAQHLNNCGLCAQKKYDHYDIKNNALFELELLRNEIFARHQYAFRNQRLHKYYSQFEWYQPTTRDVQLNAMEEHNVQLFKTRETTIKADRQALLQALKTFKTALQQDNRAFVEDLSKTIKSRSDQELFAKFLPTLKKVVGTFDLEDIHWHKGKALYEVRIDNGFAISTKRIRIQKNTIDIMVTSPEQHSSLMKEDAFDYPSRYYSEDEYTIGVKLEWNDGKWAVVQLIAMG